MTICVPPTLDLTARPASRSLISHAPLLPVDARVEPVDPVTCEKALAEWFEAPVILLASGRTGLHLALQALGYDRYRHRVAVPPYLSRCVVSAITPSAFVVDGTAADAVLLYHQYGFPQRGRPASSVVVEDIAHAFFARPDGGARPWAGDVAIFSLPKSFAMQGLGGGLVVRDPALADRVRERMANAPAAPPGVRDWMRYVIQSAYDDDPRRPERVFVDSAYELLLKFPRPDAEDLAGVPTTPAAFARVGRERAERVRVYRELLGPRANALDFWPDTEAIVPFALPYFGDGDPATLGRIDRALDEAGVRAGVYHVDIRRDMTRPEYRPCVLVPCHQAIALDRFQAICQIVKTHGR